MRTHRYKRSKSKRSKYNKRSKSKRNKRTRRTKKVGGGNLANKLEKMRRTCQQKVAKATTPLKKTELWDELTKKIEVLTHCKTQVEIPAFENLELNESLSGFPPKKADSGSMGFKKSPKAKSGSMGFKKSPKAKSGSMGFKKSPKAESGSMGFKKSPKAESGSMGFANTDESL